MSQIYSFSGDFILLESVGSKYIPLQRQQQENYGFTLEWKKHFEQTHPPSLLAELKVIEFNVRIQRIQCKYTRPHSNGEIGTFGFKPNKTKNYYIQNNKISLNFRWSKIDFAETQTQNDNINRSRISLSSFVFSPFTLMENLERFDQRMSMPSFFQQQQPRIQRVQPPLPATNRRLLFGIETTIDEEEENENQESQDPAQQEQQLLSDITVPEAIIDLPDDENEIETQNDEEEFGSLESALNRARIFDPDDPQIFDDDDIENENIQPLTTTTSLHPSFGLRRPFQGRQSLASSKMPLLTHALSQERQRRRRRQSFAASASSRFTNNNNNNGVVDADERQQQQQLPFTFSRPDIPLTSTPNNRENRQILRERNYLSQPPRISGIGETFLRDQTRNPPPKTKSFQFGISVPHYFNSARLGPSSPLKTFSPNTKTNETAEDDTEKRQSIILDNARNSLKFSDVIFLTTFDSTSNNGNNNSYQKIYANRCIIYGQSKVFDYLFEEKQSETAPIKINLNFPAEIVMRAIQFFYGKNDAIKNFENELLDFAETYSIDKLKLECLKVLPLKIEDFCENTNFAFNQSDDEFLKQKCLKFLKENKKLIGKENFKLLPLEALVELAF